MKRVSEYGLAIDSANNDSSFEPVLATKRLATHGHRGATEAAKSLDAKHKEPRTALTEG